MRQRDADRCNPSATGSVSGRGCRMLPSLASQNGNPGSVSGDEPRCAIDGKPWSVGTMLTESLEQ